LLKDAAIQVEGSSRGWRRSFGIGPADDTQAPGTYNDEFREMAAVTAVQKRASGSSDALAPEDS